MRLSGTRTGELLGAVAARCDSFVNARVRQPSDRLRQGRLLGVLVGAPFLIVATAAILFPPLVGTAATLAAAGAVAAVALVAAAATAMTGRAGFAEAGALAFGTLATACIVAAAGGLASPAALLMTAPAFEAWWVRRTKNAALTGTGAALLALGAQAVIGAELLHGAAAPSAAQWLIPIAYLASVLPRLAVVIDQADEALNTTARPLEEIVEGVVIKLDARGEVTQASEQARRILGLAPELLLSTGLFDRLHVADRVAYLCALSDLRQKEGFRRVDARLRAPGLTGHDAGDYRNFSIEMMRPDGEQELTLLIRAGDDTALARDMAASSGEAFERDGIARSRMLAAVSHELRTPLNSIIGFSDMLLTGMAGEFSDPRQKEYVGLVRESGCHLLSVANSILDVSKIECGGFVPDLEPFRFADAASACRAMMEPQAKERGVELHVDVPREVGMVHADKRAVKQILINLVSNAIKYTPEGGVVAIGAKRVGSRLHFWVSDTGIGMSADELSLVGQPFKQVRNAHTKSFDGAGLGLSLVKGLVSLHKGTMSIESEPARGTTVTVGLPVDAQSGDKRAEGGAAPIARRPSEDLDGTLRKTA